MEDFLAEALRNGTALADRYVTVKVIGSGGFGITYLAYDTETEKKVAVKEYYPKGVAIRCPDNVKIETIASFYKPEFKNGCERFYREAEILSRLCGTDVIKVYSVFAQNGTVYYAMEYVEGLTVKDYTQKYGRISEGQALYAAAEIAEAFIQIHEKNIIHRDLSPNNIMIDSDGSVKLVDFGNARPFSYDGDNSMTVALKPGYAPLEQYQHHGRQGPWTDIYSLGAVLYYGLTMKNPEDPMTRLNDDMEFKNGLSRINSSLAAIIARMTAVKIEGRYTNGQELLKDLADISIIPYRFR